MSRLAHIALRHLVSTLVIVSVSICCCQAQALTHGMSAPTVGCGSVGGGSCCSGGESSNEPADRPEAPDGCKVCCIKGSGLKHPALEMPDMQAVLPLPAIVAVLPAWPVSRVVASATPVPFVPPPTLLRQRCALIV